MPAAILTEALRLTTAGLSVIPIRLDGSKAPALASWSAYQERRAEPEELDRWLGEEQAGIAVIGGAVSGNAECIDFDEEPLFRVWMKIVKKEDPALLDRLALVSTPRPGRAVWYRSTELVPGNAKLARGYRPDEAGAMKLRTLIETRGTGGYQIVPPSPGACHPTGQPYQLAHGSLLHLPVLLPQERDLLIETAQGLNEFAEAARTSLPRPSENGNGERPGDLYNAEGDWNALLTRHGWTLAREHGGTEYWRRPGKTHGISASLHHVAPGKLMVFSTNAYPLESDHAYDLFGALARMEYGNDARATAEALHAQGYCKPTERRRIEKTQARDVTETEPAVDEEDEGDLNCTDMGNARRLAATYGNRLRFSKSHGWLVYDGKRWKRDDLQRAMHYAKLTVCSIYKEADDVNKEKGDRKKLADWGMRSEALARIIAMVKLAESNKEIAIDPEILDLDPWTLNCNNGTLDLRSGETRPHRSSDHLTRLAPVTLDPAATCPTWLTFLDQIMGGRQELVDYLQRWTGYCLTGDVSEQKLLFLYGNGSNGKSTFFHVLMQLLGDYASPSTPGLLLEHRNEQHPAAVAELAGQRLVVNSEAGQGKKLAEELLKRLTGSEPIKARFMNKDFFKFEPQYKLILSANHKPVIHGTDEAIWRRIPVVPFTAKFYEPGEGEPVKDFHIYEKLTNELPGIMNWAIAGCLAWQKSGMVAPEPVKEAAADYRAEMDILGAFLLESCERVDPSLSIRSGLLYERYKEWCSVSGETAVSQVIFSRAMIDRGFSKEKREQGIIWFGLRLADQGSEARN